jgi:hypothetical protein
MKAKTKSWVRSVMVELVVYGALVVGYFFLVLEFLAGWLLRLFEHDRRLYAVLALGLIICQGFLLEVLTRGLLAWISPTSED